MHYLCEFRNCYIFRSIFKHPVVKLGYHNKNLFSTARFPIDNISKLNRDVLLYTFERSKFYKYLSIFGFAQLTAWTFYAGMMYTSVKNVANEDLKKYEFFTRSPIWKHALGEKKSLYYAVALCVALGVLSTAVCTALPSRIVKEVILCKGGKTAVLVTYGPFGNVLKREVHLKNLSCVTSRSEAKSYLAVKVKPKWFYYLVDIRGNFPDPNLFDYTIGARASRAY